MKIINQSHEILYPIPVTYGGFGGDSKTAFLQEAKLIELAGRTAYKSEDKITAQSFETFIRKIAENNNGAVLEFGSMMVKFVTDSGVSHELVRHRLASFCQESTRYCNYGGEKFGEQITVIRPSTWDAWKDVQKEDWTKAVAESETKYLLMVARGSTPQQARSVLPNSLKTEIVMRTNFREWRHIFQLRALSKAAHPDMRNLMIPLYQQCRELLPCVFEMGEPE